MSKGASKGVTEPCPELRGSGLNSLSSATAKEKPGDTFRSGSLVLSLCSPSLSPPPLEGSQL